MTAIPPAKSMPCAACGKPIWKSSTSLPEGKATCLDCRRSRRKATRFEPELRACVRCEQMYEATRASQKYCAPCREKRTGFNGLRTRASSAARGYGAAHQRERANWKPSVETGEVECALCGDLIEPGSEWHLDHTPDRQRYRGPAHAHCNRTDGAKRGRARQDTTKLTW